MVLARIAVWEFAEPYLVTNPNSLDLSICTVSLGAKSSATRMTGSSISAISCPFPLSTLTILSEISFTSAALAFIYSSSIAANIAAQYPEADSIGVSMLIGTGLVLFVITFLVNLLARRITEKASK